MNIFSFITGLWSDSSLYLFTCILSILFAILFLLSSTREEKSATFLFGHYMALGVAFLCFFMMQARFPNHFPFLYNLGKLLIFLAMPCSYLFIRVHVTGQSAIRNAWIHTLPFLIYLIDCLPRFTQSLVTENAELLPDVKVYILAHLFQKGWLFSSYFHMVAYVIMAFSYSSGEIFLIKNMAKYRSGEFVRSNVNWRRWQIMNISICSVCLTIPLLIKFTDHPFFFFHILPICICFKLLCSGLWLYFHPSILKGGTSQLNVEPVSTSDVQAGDDRNKTGAEMEDAAVEPGMEGLSRQLKELMETREVYLNPKYSIQDLAIELNISRPKASAVIAYQGSFHFNDYINELRIRKCVQLIRDGKAKVYTLSALSCQCGFYNRNTFGTAFKKFTGYTPSEYIRMPNSAENNQG